MTALALILLMALVAIGVVVLVAFGIFIGMRKKAPLLRTVPVADMPAADSVAGKARVEVGPGPDFWFDIVGEASYLGRLQSIDGGRLANEEEVFLPLLVVPDPENRFDPNAIAVVAEGFGTVGYFSRDHAIAYRHMRASLLDQNAVGTCDGRLIGGWDETVNIGVRLSIRPWSHFDPGKPHEQEPALSCNVEGWDKLPRVELGPAKKVPVPIVDEWQCQDALQKLDAGRVAKGETVVFQALVIADPTNAVMPDGKAIMICAEGYGVLGRLSNAHAQAYSEVALELLKRGAAGECQGWLVPERAGLGVKLFVPTAKTVMKVLGDGGA